MLKEILSEKEIQKICKDIAKQIEKKFENTNSIPVLIGVMTGALPFMMDLIKNIKSYCLLDFIQVSSYSGTTSTGKITIKKDISENITGKDIVIIEDIIDTGLTFDFVTKYLSQTYHPKSITTVTLLDKKCMRKVQFEVDIVGKEIPNEFVVGYGLDYNGLIRNTTNIYVPTKAEIEEIDSLLANQ